MKITVNGQELDVERCSFTTTDAWTTVNLSDGTKIKLKPVVTGVVRINNQWTDNGDPLYRIDAPLLFAYDQVEDEIRRPELVEAVGRKRPQ